MKKFSEQFKKNKKLWTGLVLGLIILTQTVIYVIAGQNKAYLHMDEIYSYGLSNYDHVQMYEEKDFYDTWHTPAYYDDYLVVNEDEKGNFLPVYENQKNDVHPPLYYLLLRIGMEMTNGQFSKWTGIILNILIAGVTTVLMFLILDKLLAKEKNARVKALVLTLVVAVNMATVSTVVYIRMYELLTMWVLLTTYLHLKLLEAKKLEPKLLVAIGITVFLGAMTQYYYLFFAAALFVFFTVKYLRAKRMREWWGYFITLAAAGVLALVVFPFMIKHLFFSNRGGGVLMALMNPLLLLDNLWKYLAVINRYSFHLLFAVMILGLIGLGGYGLVKGKKLKIDQQTQGVFAMILVPSLFYLLIVASASPFIELRYIAPVCGLLLALTIYVLAKLLGMYFSEKVGNIVMAGILVLAGIVMPVAGQLEPDVTYRDRGAVLAEMKEYREVPALYLTKGEGDWNFLNDLLIFRELDESYIVKDLQGNEQTRDERIRKILKGKDLSKGLIVFVTDDYDKGGMMKSVEHATGLYNVEHLARMVTSDIFYITKVPD